MTDQEIVNARQRLLEEKRQLSDEWIALNLKHFEELEAIRKRMQQNLEQFKILELKCHHFDAQYYSAYGEKDIIGRWMSCPTCGLFEFLPDNTKVS